jgi:hypothetical protein
VKFLRELAPGASGRGVKPIRGDYWEQAGEPWPGECQIGKNFSTTTLTTWSFEPNHPFSGHHGSPPKRIDTIISTHGLLPTPRGSRPEYHLERFFFTDLYGPTRWEAWAPASENPPPTTNCPGAARMTYEGLEFALADCRDWSVVELNQPPKPAAPWPYPETNVLSNWHFTSNTLAPWRLESDRGAAGPAFRYELQNSKAERDTHFAPNGPGLRYLLIDCRTTQESCGATLSQTLDRDKLPQAHRVDFGVSGVMEDVGEGKVEVSLSQTDPIGKELWRRQTTVPIGHSSRQFSRDDSVYLASSLWLISVPGFQWKEGANRLRLAIKPLTPGAYDFLNAWVMPR